MLSTNDVTGDTLVSKYSTKYVDNYNTIFGKAKVKDKTENTENTDLYKFKNLFSKSNIPFIEEQYGDGVMIYIEVPSLHKDRIKVQGEGEFYSYYAFDSKGSFLYMQIGHDI